MKEPKPRYGTKAAIEQLAQDLNLPNEEWMQDWPFEVVVAADVEKYIGHYRQITDDDQKFLLMEAIIQATTDQDTEKEVEKYWLVIKPLLQENWVLHEYTVWYWSCFDSDDLSDGWTITPYLRQLWNEASA